ncbi:unnamed protein product, partial [Hapterophycus canaliculatus]
SSAYEDFAGSQSAYAAASNWHTERLRRDGATGSRAPYIVCADYRDGRSALASLANTFSRSAINRVSNTEADGSCFIVTASPAAGIALTDTPGRFSLLSASPFLPSMKLATGLLDHGLDKSPRRGVDTPNVADRSERLRSTYGKSISLENVRGLSLKLSPGILPVTGEPVAPEFVNDWHEDLMSGRVIMRAENFWSDPDADRSTQDKTRVREWSKAADVVDSLASKRGRPAGEICNLGGLRMRHVGDDLLLVQGEKLQ